MSYVLIDSVRADDAAHFRHMLNYDDRFELKEGISLTGTFPADAAYRMSDDYPDSIALHEVLYNLDSQIVVQDKVKAFLEAEGVKHVEYLAVRVLNHKGREVKARYFVINALPLIDCIDMSKTKSTRNLLDPEELTDISNLTVHEEKIPPDFQILRLKHLGAAMLMRRELAQKMRAANFRGLKISEVSEYRAT